MNLLLNFLTYTYYVKETAEVISRKPYAKLLFYLTLVTLGIILAYIPQLVQQEPSYQRPKRYVSDLKHILFWQLPKYNHIKHNYTNRPPEFLPGQTMFIQQNCSFINCFITYDKKLLSNQEDYDAIVFDIDDIRRMSLDKINMARSEEQMYIFRSLEPSAKHPICDRDFDHFFNLTWTYKLNSDIPEPFFNIYDEHHTKVGPKKNMTWIEKMKRSDYFQNKMESKNKSVAWILHKCKLKTKNQDFLEHFRRILKFYNHTLDIVGPCGKYKCRSYLKCQKYVEQNYFFQLMIEEYFAEDHVTSKIVYAMTHYTMPIVLGAGDYRNFLPPGSYINAQSFDLRKLGALIDYLMKNRDMYESIFDWKHHYYFKERPTTEVCKLCDTLNTFRTYTQSYSNLRHWWEPEYKDICERIGLLRYFSSNN